MTPQAAELPDTIDCTQALALLQDFLKRELTPALEHRLHAHLDGCAPCFRSARFQERFLAVLAERAERQRCPDGLRERVLATLRDAGAELH